MENLDILCYNTFIMKNLYYATFENGYDLIVEKFIKKSDKNAFIKQIYRDAVVFFADEHFPFKNSIFYDYYLVLDYSKKVGFGALNAEIKHLMEKKGLKINFGREVRRIRINYQSETSKKVNIDANLKKAFEIMISKVTKRQVGYFDTDAELTMFHKKSGECIFAKKLTSTQTEFSKITSKIDMLPQKAFALNFLSNPSEKEVSLDPFAGFGMISYVRALCFKKANVIANEQKTENITEIKLRAKKLKEKSFSVMNYDFLSDNFPIKFIDKIVTILPVVKSKQIAFFEKAYALKVKTLVFSASRGSDIFPIINGLFNITEEYVVGSEKIYRLDII